jgi:hypothetical protein
MSLARIDGDRERVDHLRGTLQKFMDWRDGKVEKVEEVVGDEGTAAPA